MKRGFTLIELMAVIVVLGIISVIVIPAVDRFIRSSQYASYDVQIDYIKDAAKNWAADNYNRIPDNNLESITIYLSQLKTEGYISENITNPLTKTLFSNDTTIVITKKNDGLSITVYDE